MEPVDRSREKRTFSPDGVLGIRVLEALVSAIQPVTLEAPLQFSGNLVVAAVTYPSADMNSVAWTSRISISELMSALL